MKPDSGRSARLPAAAALGFLIAVVAAFLLRGHAGDEETGHYLIARYAPGDPKLFLSLVGRPLVTLALAIPSQAGLLAARLVSGVASAVAAWAVARILLRTGWLHPLWGVALLFVQPFFLAHAATAMTEPWATALVGLAILGYVESRWWLLATVSALFPLARLELVAFWPLIAYVLFRNGAGKAAFLLLVPLPLWNFLGTATNGDPLWLLHQTEWRPYPERPPWHYLQCFGWITGAGLLAPVLVGLTEAFRKSKQADSRRALMASAALVLIYLAIYTTLAWWRPITFGNLRYFASAAPAFVLLAAAGLARLLRGVDGPTWGALLASFAGAAFLWGRYLFEDSIVLSRFNLLMPAAAAVVLLTALMPAAVRRAAPIIVVALALFGLAMNHRSTLHLGPTAEQEAMGVITSRMRAIVPANAVIHSGHPLLAFHLGRNPYDRSLHPAVTPSVLAGAPDGSFLLWEAHYAAGRGELPPQRILAAPGWQFLDAIVARDSLWTVGLFRKEAKAPSPQAAPDAGRWLAVARQAFTGIPRARELALTDPGNDMWWRNLARRYRLAGLTNASASAYLEAKRIDPDDPDNDAFQAEVYCDMRRFNDALTAIRRALSREPDNPDMNFAAALILLDLQRPAEARPHMDKAAAKLRRAEVQYVAGRLSAELSQWGEAAERFKAALEANPDHREARMYAAEALSRQGQLSSAEALLRDATRRDPGDARSWQVLGDFLVRTGRPNEARQVWTEGLSATGGDSTLASRLGANPEAPSSQE